jgi:hypothetical protein
MEDRDKDKGESNKRRRVLIPQVPEDVLGRCGIYLDTRSLCSALSVCKSWYALYTRDEFFKPVFDALGGGFDEGKDYYKIMCSLTTMPRRYTWAQLRGMAYREEGIVAMWSVSLNGSHLASYNVPIMAGFRHRDDEENERILDCKVTDLALLRAVVKFHLFSKARRAFVASRTLTFSYSQAFWCSPYEQVWRTARLERGEACLSVHLEREGTSKVRCSTIWWVRDGDNYPPPDFTDVFEG